MFSVKPILYWKIAPFIIHFFRKVVFRLRWLLKNPNMTNQHILGLLGQMIKKQFPTRTYESCLKNGIPELVTLE